jgi:hypothetical protein
VVVRAAGQDLPELPEGTVVADDTHEGKGPVQGIAAGLAALSGHAEVALARAHEQGPGPRLLPGIFSAFGTPKLEFHEVLWDGDVATIRFTMTGRHVDEFRPRAERPSRCPASPSCISAATVSSSVSPRRICWAC